MRRRSGAVGLMATALVATGGYVAFRETRETCGTEVLSHTAAHSSSPFLDAEARRDQPDADRDALVATLGRSAEVVGAVGYHYEQWADVGAYAQGLGLRTRDNPDFTMLDDDLRPRWSVEVRAARSTYDADEGTYLVVALPRSGPPTVVALDAHSGKRRWCRTWEGVRVGRDDVVATQLLGRGVAVLAGDRLVRLGGDGEESWTSSPRAGTGDFLGDLGGGVLLAGGVGREVLLDPSAVGAAEAGRSLAAVSTSDGGTRWSRDVAAGTVEHVVGTDPETGTAVVESRSAAGGRLLALDRDGEEVWSVSTGRDPVDVALRSGRVLTRVATRFTAYDLEGGGQVWTRTLPDRPQLLPYGFELGSAPLLDAEHLLLATTTALRSMDLRTGAVSTYAALPTDGISTTYWPYEVAVAEGRLAVATNTGAVVLDTG